MTELTDLSDTDALNTAVTGNSTEGNTANMGGMDNLFQATLGMLSRFRNSNIFRLRDNTDKTKLLAFDLSGLTTATTLTVKVPNGLPTYGQCRLALDGANLRLSPYGGNLLTIDGYGHKVPSAGITLAPGVLVSGTVYNIYAYMNAGTMTLEASTTAHATDTATGVEIKSGDATRTLVGMAQPLTGPTFTDTAALRLVRTWFNRAPVTLQGAGVASTRTTTSTSLTEINTETRVSFLVWAGELVHAVTNGWATSSTSESVHTAVGLDGASTRTKTSTVFGLEGGPAISSGILAPSEGSHFITLIGAVSAGTGSWITNSGARDGVSIGGSILC